jgi:hypothetical protein
MNLRSWAGSAGIVFLFAAPAMPFCLAPQPRLVCAEYFNSAFVVTATLTKATTIPENASAPVARIYTLRVNRILRGKPQVVVQVFEENSSGRAGFAWVLGQEYLLFLSYSENDHTLWELDGCGNSGPITRAATALSVIGAIQTARGSSTIQGVVGGYGGPLLSGMHIEARGQAGRFAAITDDKGEFQMRVALGQYSVNVIEAGRYFDRFDLGYSDIEKPLEPGGCAQIQFIELPAPLSP